MSTTGIPVITVPVVEEKTRLVTVPWREYFNTLGGSTGGGGSGTVQSVNIAGSNGLTVSGSPITTAGTVSLAIPNLSTGQITAVGVTVSTISASRLSLLASTTGVVGVTVSSTTSTWLMTLPTTTGTVSQVLQTDGTGLTSWATVSSSGGSGTVLSVNVAGANGITVSGSGYTITGTVSLAIPTLSTGQITALAAAYLGTVTALGVSVTNTVTSAGVVATGTITALAATVTTIAAVNLSVSNTVTSLGIFVTNTVTAGGVSAANTISSSGVFAVNTISAARIALSGGTTSIVSVTVTNGTSWTMTLPTVTGTVSQVLQTDGTGKTSWISSSGGGFTAASQAQMEAATDNTVGVTPLAANWHPGTAKVWCRAENNGTIDASWNMTSLTDVGTGQITFNIATDFSSNSYSSNITIFDTGTALFPTITAQAAGSVSATCYSILGVATDPNAAWMFTAHGDQ